MSESAELKKQVDNLEQGFAEIAKVIKETGRDFAKRGILLKIPEVESGELERV